MTTFETVRSVLASTFEIDPSVITPTTAQADVSGWDSVGHINLMLALEETFGVRLEVEDMLKLTSVVAIVTLFEPPHRA